MLHTASWLMMQVMVRLTELGLLQDIKVPNAATFTLQREDHTVGNMLRMCGASAFLQSKRRIVAATGCRVQVSEAGS